MSRHRRAGEAEAQSSRAWLQLVPDAATGSGGGRRSAARHARPEVASIDEDAQPLTVAVDHPVPARRIAGSGTRRRSMRGSLRKPVLVGVAALTCLLTVGAGTAAALTKTVSIVLDGQIVQVRTMSGTVDGALSTAGLRLGEHDALAPAGTAQISDGSTIVVDRARKLELTIDGQRREVWTTARTVEQALAQLGLTDQGNLQLSANRSREIPLDGLAVSGTTTVAVTLVVGGDAPVAATSKSVTVAELLAERGIRLGPLDLVRPAVNTPLAQGASVTVDRVAVTTRTETHKTAKPADRKVPDPALEQGQTKVVQQGAAGTVTVTFEVRTVNGREVAKKETARVVAAAAKPTIIRVGTGTPDPAGEVAAAAAEKKFTYKGSQVFTNDKTFGVNWDGLAFCESTHNPKAVNGNPSAGLPTYGMFQFDIPTWESVGGKGNPMDASPSEQLMRSKKLYLQRGLEPWACRGSAR